MLLNEAKALRAEIRATNIHCIVPLGYKPNKYFCRIFVGVSGPAQPVDFHTREDWLAYQEKREEERAKRLAEIAMRLRPRSPIEMLIDQACELQ